MNSYLPWVAVSKSIKISNFKFFKLNIIAYCYFYINILSLMDKRRDMIVKII